MTQANELAVSLLCKDEGFRETPYYCTEGYPTIGYGFKIGSKNAPLPNRIITKQEAQSQLSEIVRGLELLLCGVEGYKECTAARQAILISIAYQIGYAGLMKFKNMLNAINRQEWLLASDCMLDSVAARQTPERWSRNAKVMRCGVME